jgi:hypothetical protein
MPNVTLTFTHTINRSAQVGDIIYFTPAHWQGGSRQAKSDYSGMTKMGPIISISRTLSGGTIVVDHDPNQLAPSSADFIFFSKDNMANMSSILGYYAEVKFVNKSNSKIELFQVGTDMFESSK